MEATLPSDLKKIDAIQISSSSGKEEEDPKTEIFTKSIEGEIEVQEKGVRGGDIFLETVEVIEEQDDVDQESHLQLPRYSDL